MTTLKIPTPLRYYTNGQAEVAVNGTDVATAMRNLVEQYPTLEQHLYNGKGEMRAFVNLFLGQDNISPPSVSISREFRSLASLALSRSALRNLPGW